MKKNRILRLTLGIMAVGVIIVNITLKSNNSESNFNLDVLGLGLVANAEDSEITGGRTKYCRRVDCSDLWAGTANAEGCITIFTKKFCNFAANGHVEYTYFGENENCTGGEEWYDCDACQDDCVPTDD